MANGLIAKPTLTHWDIVPLCKRTIEVLLCHWQTVFYENDGKKGS